MASVPPSPRTRAASGQPSAAPDGHDEAMAPEAARSLADRDQEIGELRGLARDGGLVTLLGEAGTGKTRLLKALLSALDGEFPDGTFRVDLGDLRRPDLVAARVAAALRVSEEPGVPLADTLASALRGRQIGRAHV